MEGSCYECGQLCNSSNIAGYAANISPIRLSDNTEYHLDKIERQYLKYTKIQPPQNVITNYVMICKTCELDFVLNRRSLLVKFKKCDKCNCYSEMDGEIINLIDDIYELNISEDYCIFKYNEPHKKNLKLCIECCTEILRKNQKTSIIECTKCNKKIGKPKHEFLPCNNVIFITSKIFVIDACNPKLYLDYCNYWKEEEECKKKKRENIETKTPITIRYSEEEINDFETFKSNDIIGLYDYNDQSNNFMTNDLEINYVFNNFKVDKLYSSVLYEAATEQNIGDQICLKCINEIGYESYLCRIKCDLCNNIFESIFEGNSGDQGYGCSCTVFDNFIKGSYGSVKYDCEQINFTNGKPSNIKFLSNICDNCVTQLIANGICEEIVNKTYD